MFALLLHIYNHDSWENFFKDQLKNLQNYQAVILINLCLTHRHNFQLISAIKADFPEAAVITTPNKGRDIGGKLALIDFFLRAKLQAEYIVLLHDKQSPHWSSGEAWRQKLFAIIEPQKITAILGKFGNDPAIGVIGAGEFIRNEYDNKTNEFKTTNNNKLKELIAKYSLRITDYGFIAGTMFWMRSGILQKFFSMHSALDCREMLEEGNFIDDREGTYTHSWERVFCWLANDQNYCIKGIK